MTINFEVKGILARLLATEDIDVIHSNVSTASFNVENRTLILPMWEKATSEVYDLLVAHECGHSIFTPSDMDLYETYVPFDIINIIEDVRIEKLMKRKYPGLRKTFYNGYKQFAEENYFGTNGKDISEFSIVDRINIYFKIGTFLNVPFTEEERKFLENIENIETFDEVLEQSELVYEYFRRVKKSSSKLDIFSKLLESIQSGTEYEEDDSSTDNKESLEDSEDSEEPEEDEVEEDEVEEDEVEEDEVEEDEEDEEDEFESETNSYLEEILGNLISTNNQITYIQIPDVNLKNIIVPNELIHNICNNYWVDKSFTDEWDQEYLKYKKSAFSEVNYLVKEFQCKKSADLYSRSSVSSTGVLDCKKLHMYKYCDDIFKRVEVKPGEKNHGLVFILDWSQSMSDILLNTLKQLYCLIWFCRKVNIPFDVYAFTTGFDKNLIEGYTENQEQKNIKINDIIIPKEFSLMNILTSKVNASVLDKQMRNIFRAAYSCNNYYHSIRELQLSSTPLNETIISLHKILPQFKKQYELQKVHCIILTDGESGSSYYYKEVTLDGEAKIHKTYIPSYSTSRCYIKDPKTKNVYALGEYRTINSDTEILLRNLKDNFPDINLLGVRLMKKPKFKNFASIYHYGKSLSKLLNVWTKDNSAFIKNSSYDSYIIIANDSIQKKVSSDLPKNATKSQIKRDFINGLNTKKTNKKILNEFISYIV